jgi:hypothetical protein
MRRRAAANSSDQADNGGGEKRPFCVGDVVLMEDNSGKGHTTFVTNAQECVAAISPVLD